MLGRLGVDRGVLVRTGKTIEELRHGSRTYRCGLNYLWGDGQPVQTLRDPCCIKSLCSQLSTGGGLARETVGVVRSSRQTPRAPGLRGVVDASVIVPMRPVIICCRNICPMLCSRRHGREAGVRVVNVEVRPRALVVPVISGRMGVWVVHWLMIAVESSSEGGQ